MYFDYISMYHVHHPDAYSSSIITSAAYMISKWEEADPAHLRSSIAWSAIPDFRPICNFGS